MSAVFKNWLDVEFTYKNGYLDCKFYFTINGCDDEVLGTILFFEKTNVAIYRFYFDEIEKNFHTLDLVNTYNAHSHTLMAYIDEDPENGTSIILEHECLVTDERTVREYTDAIMRALLSDGSIEDLIPITELTD